MVVVAVSTHFNMLHHSFTDSSNYHQTFISIRSLYLVESKRLLGSQDRSEDSCVSGSHHRLSERCWKKINQIYRVSAKWEWLTKIEPCLFYCHCLSTNRDIYCGLWLHNNIPTAKEAIKLHLWVQIFGYLKRFLQHLLVEVTVHI